MKKITVLPTREVMWANLLLMEKTDPNLARFKARRDDHPWRIKFYPLLLKHAGEELYAEGVVMMLQIAIADYEEIIKSPEFLRDAMHCHIPALIDAMVGDSDIAQDAKNFWQAVLVETAEVK
ncbi:MAG: hypothetical protein A2528_03795 [Candidatus Staskawiczbacteria bacterium RIFOXYD2_FULL_37_9]|uniref:Uncharacterized protein n=1 Tax=Candidatus Staskawiczbacteria bacterium RIFOXYB1_FULL_37_44 TaxID=1802223 RepID=A0A1G2IX38_9BACT|nr:MAG: hypothetical protein A2358_00340 [Candidatus Staskawiczbacteria bacterium RIFOXYB1_FULL_37_44]OGZ83463.1 MAG: hypothetical protein A2416_04005 [Candidatus Staskawiczbacteria bacterium RIFOXYC1_FULL_37_52]OGZ88487.1 MAG: hypothetical protein A2444_02645 [Candidatus Staskawiczbacteria bacterium RIFOXYC2_FULL_37_19]OGZ90199.1 MAG: hypothetical protein A2581_02200 [Candidatus Staskawiczbacteria bacterium RIFOXYD1_FULL_37_110]OGZ94856.1 MAG: hypothetical protein A2528_03795 [Candidatus Stask